MVEGDWRLMGQEVWLTGRDLHWRDWAPFSPGWEHDHCAFCWAAFAAVKADGVGFTAGYVTADDCYTWICPPCFEDFKAPFQWHVLPLLTEP